MPPGQSPQSRKLDAPAGIWSLTTRAGRARKVCQKAPRRIRSKGREVGGPEYSSIFVAVPEISKQTRGSRKANPSLPTSSHSFSIPYVLRVVLIP